MRQDFVAIALVCAVALGACVHIGPAPMDTGGCDRASEAVVLKSATSAVADRRAENKLGLPWTDTLPPQVVRDAASCRAAAVGYAGGRLPAGMPARASVVRAGGLYFVLTPLRRTAGEYTLVGVLDGRYHWLIGLTT